jgi:hypothetical protein
MAGNVYDWCNDWWVCHVGVSPVVDPTGPASGSRRVVRSSCWGDRYTSLPSAKRANNSPATADYVAGFRVARTSSACSAGTKPDGDASTRISYAIPPSVAGSHACLAVFDHAGRRVCTLADGEQKPGVHIVSWDGTDAQGNPVQGGAYLYRLTAGEMTATRRVLLIR